MTGLEIFLGILFLLYYLFLIVTLIKWQVPIAPIKLGGPLPKLISVVIPFRNEGANLPQLIADLKNQSIERNGFEVILVNDHSTDSSESICKKLISDFDQFSLISLSKNIEGKKRAITEGISIAKGSIIVTTDADCRLPQDWLKSIHTKFSDQDLNLLIGSVAIEPDKSIFSKLQSLESVSLAIITAAFAKIKKPIMCSGANLAFRKSAFHEVNGYVGNFTIPSGDDEFLMRKINNKFPDSISYHHEPEAVVRTKPLRSFKDFINQRIRWAGKWKHNKFSRTSLVAIFVFLFYTGFFISIILAILGRVDIVFFMSLFFVKLIVEFVVLKPVSKFLTLKWDWMAFSIMQVFYFPYVLLVSVLSQRTTTWKGRILSKQMGSIEMNS